MAGCHTDLVDLGDGCQDELGFHEGEVVADAEMGAATEGEVGEVWATCGTLGREAFGIKVLWHLPEVGVAMGDVF